MKNITSEITKYVNYQNKSLWEELKNQYNIQLYYKPTEYSWLVQIDGKDVKIVCNDLEVNIASFTHELLHVKLDQQGMPNFDQLDYFILNNPIFNNFILKNLIYKVYNFHSHKKMFPIFLSMGFQDEDFVSAREKFSIYENIRLRLFPKIKLLKTFGIEEFLGKYFALKNDFVASNQKKTQRNLRNLQRINKELFNVAECFDSDWENRSDLDYIASLEMFSEKYKPYFIKTYGR